MILVHTCMHQLLNVFLFLLLRSREESGSNYGLRFLSLATNKTLVNLSKLLKHSLKIS